MLIIGNGFVIESIEKKSCIQNGAVAVAESVIVDVGETEQIKEKYPDAEFIDAKGGIICAGFVDAHSRLMSVYERKRPVGGFIDAQKKIRWKTDRKLTLEAVKAGAAEALAECIDNGITSVFNVHASYGAVSGSLAAVSEAAEEAGIHVYSAYEVSDRDGGAKAEEALAEAENGCLIGCDAAFNLSDETLSSIAASQKGIHMSVSECDFDENTSWKKYQMSVVERLDAAGALDPDTIAAHCNLVSEEDMEIMQKSGANAVLCPAADMENGLAPAPAQALTGAGILTGIGTDGGFNMLQALRAYAQLFKGGLYGGADKAVEALAANARLLEKITGEDKTELSAGSPADIIVIGKKPCAGEITADNAAEYMVYSADEITAVVCGGRVLKNITSRQACEEADKLYLRVE